MEFVLVRLSTVEVRLWSVSFKKRDINSGQSRALTAGSEAEIAGRPSEKEKMGAAGRRRVGAHGRARFQDVFRTGFGRRERVG